MTVEDTNYQTSAPALPRLLYIDCTSKLLFRVAYFQSSDLLTYYDWVINRIEKSKFQQL